MFIYFLCTIPIQIFSTDLISEERRLICEIIDLKNQIQVILNEKQEIIISFKPNIMRITHNNAELKLKDLSIKKLRKQISIAEIRLKNIITKMNDSLK